MFSKLVDSIKSVNLQNFKLLLVFLTLIHLNWVKANTSVRFNKEAGLALAKADGTIVGSRYAFKNNWKLRTVDSPEFNKEAECVVQLIYETDKAFFLVKTKDKHKNDKVGPGDMVYFVSPEKPLLLYDMFQSKSGQRSEKDSICNKDLNASDLGGVLRVLNENFELFQKKDGDLVGSRFNELFMSRVQEEGFSLEWIENAINNDGLFWDSLVSYNPDFYKEYLTLESVKQMLTEEYHSEVEKVVSEIQEHQIGEFKESLKTIKEKNETGDLFEGQITGSLANAKKTGDAVETLSNKSAQKEIIEITQKPKSMKSQMPSIDTDLFAEQIQDFNSDTSSAKNGSKQYLRRSRILAAVSEEEQSQSRVNDHDEDHPAKTSGNSEVSFISGLDETLEMQSVEKSPKNKIKIDSSPRLREDLEMDQSQEIKSSVRKDQASTRNSEHNISHFTSKHSKPSFDTVSANKEIQSKEMKGFSDESSLFSSHSMTSSHEIPIKEDTMSGMSSMSLTHESGDESLFNESKTAQVAEKSMISSQLSLDQESSQQSTERVKQSRKAESSESSEISMDQAVSEMSVQSAFVKTDDETGSTESSQESLERDVSELSVHSMSAKRAEHDKVAQPSQVSIDQDVSQISVDSVSLGGGRKEVQNDTRNESVKTGETNKQLGPSSVSDHVEVQKYNQIETLDESSMQSALAEEKQWELDEFVDKIPGILKHDLASLVDNSLSNSEMLEKLIRLSQEFIREMMAKMFDKSKNKLNFWAYSYVTLAGPYPPQVGPEMDFNEIKGLVNEEIISPRLVEKLKKIDFLDIEMLKKDVILKSKDKLTDLVFRNLENDEKFENYREAVEKVFIGIHKVVESRLEFLFTKIFKKLVLQTTDEVIQNYQQYFVENKQNEKYRLMKDKTLNLHTLTRFLSLRRDFHISQLQEPVNVPVFELINSIRLLL